MEEQETEETKQEPAEETATETPDLDKEMQDAIAMPEEALQEPKI